MMNIGFDNEKYLQMQSAHIRERIAQFDNKLYLEFGGKLFDDFHASRVLPGFQPDSKMRMLMQLSDQAEIVIVISAEDIEKNKVRGDREFDSCLHFFTNQIAQNVDYINAFEFFYCQICENKCTNMD